MAVTFQVVGDGSVGTKTRTYTVSDADVNRLVAYGKALTGTSNATVAQGLLAWADRMMALTKTDVLAYERDVATSGIVPITAV